MEELTSAQKSTVSKSSSDGLRLLLLRSGYAEEVVLCWSIDQLMTKYASSSLGPSGGGTLSGPRTRKGADGA